MEFVNSKSFDEMIKYADWQTADSFKKLLNNYVSQLEKKAKESSKSQKPQEKIVEKIVEDNKEFAKITKKTKRGK